MRMMKMFMMALLAGCVPASLAVHTPSGTPEVLVLKVTVAQIKPEITRIMQSYDHILASESDSMLVYEKSANLAQAAVGATSNKIKFILTPENGGIHVIAYCAVSMNAANGGETSYDKCKYGGELQTKLEAMKTALEK